MSAAGMTWETAETAVTAIMWGAALGASLWLYMSTIWTLSFWAHRAKHARLEAWERGEPKGRGLRGWIAHDLARRELKRLCSRLPAPGDLLLSKRPNKLGTLWLVAEVHVPQPLTPQASVTLLLADAPLSEPVVFPVLQFYPKDYEVVSPSARGERDT